MRPDRDGADAVLACIQECANLTSHARFRCVRDPQRASLVDARGALLLEAATEGDAAVFEMSAGELVQLRVEFSSSA
jgi:hypothetical protein